MKWLLPLLLIIGIVVVVGRSIFGFHRDKQVQDQLEYNGNRILHCVNTAEMRNYVDAVNEIAAKKIMGNVETQVKNQVSTRNHNNQLEQTVNENNSLSATKQMTIEETQNLYGKKIARMEQNIKGLHKIVKMQQKTMGSLHEDIKQYQETVMSASEHFQKVVQIQIGDDDENDNEQTNDNQDETGETLLSDESFEQSNSPLSILTTAALQTRKRKHVEHLKQKQSKQSGEHPLAKQMRK